MSIKLHHVKIINNYLKLSEVEVSIKLTLKQLNISSTKHNLKLNRKS